MATDRPDVTIRYNPHYKGIIALDQDYVGSNPDLNNVAPGMTVLADIHTGTKTLLEYL